MRIKRPVLLLFLMFSALTSFAESESPFSHCELTTRGLTSEHIEFISTPANLKISSETGIQILSLKKTLLYSTMRFSFALEPIRLHEDKLDLADDVARFLNTFPKDFLSENPDICFILVESTQKAEAMTTKNVIFLPIDASYEAMAHEFMHAVDDLNDDKLDYEAWDMASGSCLYERDVDIDRGFAAGSLDHQCFITPYAKTDLWEDRAEIFSALFRNQLSSEQSSPIQRKATELKKFLRTISPSMNENFWNAQREFSW